MYQTKDQILKEEFLGAVSNGCSEEEIDKILDEKNRRDAEFRKSLMMGFQVAFPRPFYTMIPSIPCP